VSARGVYLGVHSVESVEGRQVTLQGGRQVTLQRGDQEPEPGPHHVVRYGAYAAFYDVPEGRPPHGADIESVEVLRDPDDPERGHESTYYWGWGLSIRRLPGRIDWGRR